MIIHCCWINLNINIQIMVEVTKTQFLIILQIYMFTINPLMFTVSYIICYKELQICFNSTVCSFPLQNIYYDLYNYILIKYRVFGSDCDSKFLDYSFPLFH